MSNGVNEMFRAEPLRSAAWLARRWSLSANRVVCLQVNHNRVGQS